MHRCLLQCVLILSFERNSAMITFYDCATAPSPRRALEKALGGPDEVVPAYRAWLSASENDNDQVGKKEAARASKWQKASDLARQAGFRSLGESTQAYFEFKLSR